MKERSIIMTAESVRAILDGRKTQTRRVVKPQPPNRFAHPLFAGGILTFHEDHPGDFPMWDRHLVPPFGWPGDRLWVRETFGLNQSLHMSRGGTIYRADVGEPGVEHGHHIDGYGRELKGERRWRSSIHMPRWASRITLEITRTRVERVQEISKDGCVAEGIQIPCDEQHHALLQLSGKHAACLYPPASGDWKTATLDDYFRAYYASLWDNLNAQRGFPWSSNPFVWVLEFQRVEQDAKAAAA